MSKNLLADGKTPNGRRLGEKSENHFEGPVIPLGAMIEYHPISTRDQSMLLMGGIWKGGVLVADIEELRTLDASEVRARKLNAKETKTPKKGEQFTLQFAHGGAKLIGRSHGFRESTFKRENKL